MGNKINRKPRTYTRSIAMKKAHKLRKLKRLQGIKKEMNQIKTENSTPTTQNVIKSEEIEIKCEETLPKEEPIHLVDDNNLINNNSNNCIKDPLNLGNNYSRVITKQEKQLISIPVKVTYEDKEITKTFQLLDLVKRRFGLFDNNCERRQSVLKSIDEFVSKYRPLYANSTIITLNK